MYAKGDKLDHFTIVGEIGRGGMGTIYKALDEMLNRYVALKIIHPQLAKDDQLMERFKAEAMTQAQLSHPNIVTVYSFNRIGSEFVMVMEYVEGQSLKELIQKERILPVGYALGIIKKVLSGLAYAHEKQVIHRDVKPANILVGTDGVVKLLDFGIAKIFGTQGLTKTGALIGTPWYCSPEQILGLEMDYRTDLYSAAITFYQMITGRVPFDSENNSEYQIQKAHLETPPPRPTLFNAYINRNLEQIVLKGLAKKREKRYVTAQNMIDALVAVEADYERATPPGVSVQESRSGGGHRLYLWFWVLVPLALLLLYMLLTKSTVPPAAETVAPRQAESAPVKAPSTSVQSSRPDPLGSAPAEEINSEPLVQDSMGPKSEPITASPQGIKDAEKKNGSGEKQGEITATKVGQGTKKGDVEEAFRVERELGEVRRMIESRRFLLAERTVDRLLKRSMNPRALCLAGTVKWLAGHHEDGVSLWRQGLAAGGEIRLAVAHAHGFVPRGCLGFLTIRSNLLMFDSGSKKEHSFAIILKELISATSNGNQLVLAWKDKSKRAQRDFFMVDWSQSETDYERLAAFITRLGKEE